MFALSEIKNQGSLAGWFCPLLHRHSASLTVNVRWVTILPLVGFFMRPFSSWLAQQPHNSGSQPPDHNLLSCSASSESISNTTAPLHSCTCCERAHDVLTRCGQESRKLESKSLNKVDLHSMFKYEFLEVITSKPWRIKSPCLRYKYTVGTSFFIRTLAHLRLPFPDA